MDSVQLLVAGLVVMTLINVSIFVWAFLGNRSHKSAPEKPAEPQEPLLNLDLSHVEHTAEQQLQAAVEASKGRLQESINKSIDIVASRIGQVADTTVNQEFEKYTVTMEALQTQSVQEFSKLQAELQKKHDELMQTFETQVAAEMEKRMDKFNEHLNDVVSSYIAESLGNNVDLGAQSMYIIRTLEEHKEDIKRDSLS